MVVLSHWNSHAQEKPSDDSRSRDDKADLSAGQSTEPSQAALSSTSPRNRLNGQDPSSAASSPQAEPPHCKSPAPQKHEVGSKLYNSISSSALKADTHSLSTEAATPGLVCNLGWLLSPARITQSPWTDLGFMSTFAWC